MSVHPMPERRPSVRALTLAELIALELPTRAMVLSPWLPSQGLTMAYGPRGTGKTHLVLAIGYAVATGGTLLGWSAPAPRRVLYLDGEMPAPALQERLAALVAGGDHEPPSPEFFRVITPDFQDLGMPDLASREGQAAIEAYVQQADLIVVDNLSTLARSGKENEGEGWLPVQDWALGLRAAGKSVLFVHHAGKGGQQRGSSRREDVLDTVIALRRPSDYQPDQGARFEVHFEKARGFRGDEAKAFEAALATDGQGRPQWTMRSLDDCLTERVAALINDGLSMREAAEELATSKSNVHRHKQKAGALGLLKEGT